MPSSAINMQTMNEWISNITIAHSNAIIWSIQNNNYHSMMICKNKKYFGRVDTEYSNKIKMISDSSQK